jgi:hypothetical protein
VAREVVDEAVKNVEWKAQQPLSDPVRKRIRREIQKTHDQICGKIGGQWAIEKYRSQTYQTSGTPSELCAATALREATDTLTIWQARQQASGDAYEILEALRNAASDQRAPGRQEAERLLQHMNGSTIAHIVKALQPTNTKRLLGERQQSLRRLAENPIAYRSNTVKRLGYEVTPTLEILNRGVNSVIPSEIFSRCAEKTTVEQLLKRAQFAPYSTPNMEEREHTIKVKLRERIEKLARELGQQDVTAETGVAIARNLLPSWVFRSLIESLNEIILEDTYAEQ